MIIGVDYNVQPVRFVDGWMTDKIVDPDGPDVWLLVTLRTDSGGWDPVVINADRQVYYVNKGKTWSDLARGGLKLHVPVNPGNSLHTSKGWVKHRMEALRVADLWAGSVK